MEGPASYGTRSKEFRRLSTQGRGRVDALRRRMIRWPMVGSVLVRWLLLFIGGGIGTILRYQVSGLVQDQLGSAYPWGTFIVNVTGCFAIGVFATLADERGMLGSPARLFLMIGVTGGYTTFSTFALETWRLLQAGDLVPAVANAAGSVLVGLIGLVLGVFLGRLAL